MHFGGKTGGTCSGFGAVSLPILWNRKGIENLVFALENETQVPVDAALTTHAAFGFSGKSEILIEAFGEKRGAFRPEIRGLRREEVSEGGLKPTLRSLGTEAILPRPRRLGVHAGERAPVCKERPDESRSEDEAEPELKHIENAPPPFGASATPDAGSVIPTRRDNPLAIVREGGLPHVGRVALEY